MGQDDLDYHAREIVQIMVGVLGTHKLSDVPIAAVGEMVMHVRRYLGEILLPRRPLADPPDER